MRLMISTQKYTCTQKQSCQRRRPQHAAVGEAIGKTIDKVIGKVFGKDVNETIGNAIDKDIGKDIGNDFHLIIWVDYKNPDLAEFVDERKDGSMKQFMFGERDADGEYTEEYHYDDADKLIADAKKILTA